MPTPSPTPSPTPGTCIATLAPLVIGHAILAILETDGGTVKSTLSRFQVPLKSAYRWVSAARTQREMLLWQSSDAPTEEQRAALQNLDSVAIFQFLRAYSVEPGQQWDLFISGVWVARRGRLKLTHLKHALASKPGQNFDRRDRRTKRIAEARYRLSGLRKYLNVRNPTAAQRRDAAFTLDEVRRLLGPMKEGIR